MFPISEKTIQKLIIKGKRLIDTILVTGGIIVFFIPMIIIAICIKVDSKGPVIFEQKRLGKGKKPFMVKKFRTMCDHYTPVSAV